jgi:superfamily II DNA/RNA helicase
MDCRDLASPETMHSEGIDDLAASEEMSCWGRFGLSDPIIRAIRTLGFHQPTPIQIESLARGLQDRKDIIGAAETVGFAR